MVKCWVILLLSLNLALASNKEPLQHFKEATKLFTAAVYKEIIQKNDGNFLVSPYSAETVLAFAQSGCKGDSAQEIRRSLNLPDDKNVVEADVKASIPLITGNELYTLYTANKMYVKKNFNINEDFKKAATESYEADIESIDFLKNVEAANTINKWVEEKTNNKIKNLINSETLDVNTRLILINALYFKALWTNHFVEQATSKQKFYKTAENNIDVDMMYQHPKHFNYFESAELNAKFLELPFQGGEASMVIVLPNEIEGLKSLESQVDKVFLPQNFTNEFLNVAIPKFKIESTIPFVDILKNLGVKSVFDDKLADLSGIAGKPGDLVISDVLQKTYINVKEGGVEAAAAAYVAFGYPGSAVLRPIPKYFTADHPFIFYIKAKNFIIFAGRVVSP